MAKKSFGVLDVVAPLVTVVLLLCVWQYSTIFFKIPKYVLPGSFGIIQKMFTAFPEIQPHLVRNLTTRLVGFVLAVPFGILFAAVVTNFKTLDRAIGPYVILLVTTPMITLVPLLMYWLGFGIEVKILTVILQAFPIVNMNASTGFVNVDHIRIELMESLAANRRQKFFFAVLPSSLPDVFTGIKLASIFATTACISAEFIGGTVGLGSKIISDSSLLKTEQAFACIFYVALIGVSLYGIVSLAQRLVIKWKS